MGWKDLVGPITGIALGEKAGAYADSLFNSSSPGKQRKKEYERQKEFAQNSVQWRVADAIAAGIHPLAALGMQPMSYAAQSVGNDAGLDFGTLEGMGQDITRAAMANSSSEDKALYSLGLERAGLENELLRARIMSEKARLNQSPVARGPFGMLMEPSQKGDSLSSGGTELLRAKNGSVWLIPPGADAGVWEEILGDPGDTLGGAANFGAMLQAEAQGGSPGIGVWPGVLGF